MFSFQNDNIVVIPVAYNVFSRDCNNIENLSIPSFALTISLANDFIAELIEYTKTIENKFICIDLEHVSSYASRAFSLFLELNNIDNIIFYNVKADTFLANGIIEELSSKLKNDITLDKSGKPISDPTGAYFFSAVTKEFFESLEMYNSAYELSNSYLKETIENVIDKKTTFLESSSVYSNMYVALKRLFISQSETTYIIYKLAELFIEEFQEADAIISTSKTGAVFACLISKLVGKKAVHCAGVGPKFSLSSELLKKEVRPNKKYAYICDFICLGTEVKILNALVNSLNATLIGGVCVASYIDLENDDFNGGILSKSFSLINIIAQGIDYRVSPEKNPNDQEGLQSVS